MNPSLFLGGKYPNAPMRHRHYDKETLRDFLLRKGYRFHSNPLLADVYVARDHEEFDLEILTKRREANKYSVLLRSEPSCVLPDAYEPEIELLYNRKISFGKHQGNDAFFWPQYWEDSPLLRPSPERSSNRASLINANKLSLFPSEMYSLRRQVIAELSSLDLFGEGWNISKLSRLKTLVIEIRKQPVISSLVKLHHARLWFRNWPRTDSPESKLTTLQKYRVNVVIENDLSYMSEKLFDAFSAGCIPVYVGPKIEDYGIPESFVIQAEPSVNSIQKSIELALEIKHSKFMADIASWLALDETKELHDGYKIMEIVFADVIEEFLQTDLTIK